MASAFHMSDTCPPELRPILSGNRIPDKVESIHLIAVCGTAMGALAAMLKDLGYRVTGSDQNIYPPMSTFLREQGIRLFEGFSEENLAAGPDLVVVGNTVRRDNPEANAVRRRKMPFCSMPQAINHFIAAGKKHILVTGTHGKTTTSALLAWILFRAHLDPSFVVGGILADFSSNCRLGGGPHIVLEGDEYDTAFFDKGPKFFHYDPAVAVLTGVEFDHADIYRDLAHVQSAFSRFVAAMEPEACLVAVAGDPNLASVLAGSRCRILRYGWDRRADWSIGKVIVAPPWTEFQVLRQGQPHGGFRTRLMGEHNLLNILSTIAAADLLSISMDAVRDGLESFSGVRRRQEVRGVRKGITVMDDFAHHPTAVRETIRAVRPFFPAGRLIAVFEPRTNSSMRNVFQTVYPTAFDGADLVCIRKPPLLSKIPEAERFSSETLVEDLRKRGKNAWFFEETDGIIQFLTQEARPHDLVLIMSNGGFDNIHERLLKELEKSDGVG